MPELPEVETTLKGIKPWLVNQNINAVNVFNASLRWPIPDSVFSLKDHCIKNISRRAKYLLIELSNHSNLIMHLGMSGVIRILNDNEPYQKHDHFELLLSNGKSLRLNDPRRFGCVLHTDEKIENHKLIKDLGPEPLSEDFNGQWLKKSAKKRTVSVKNFVMNNHIVVGVGNIYAAESLFHAGIKPNKKVNTISLNKFNRLADKIKMVLNDAIKAGGTTLKDFKDSSGKPGYFQQKLYVYGRSNQPCLICKSIIKNQIIGQRASCYCPICQK